MDGTKNEGKNLSLFFEENSYKKIAIYGFADIGQRFYEELNKSSKLEVVYIIDKNADCICAELDVYAPTPDLPEADVIVVTPVFAYNEIEKMLKKLVPYPVVSIEDVVYDM